MWDFERDWECYNGCCNFVIERSLCGFFNVFFCVYVTYCCKWCIISVNLSKFWYGIYSYCVYFLSDFFNGCKLLVDLYVF